ncbi:MAG: RNA polymerase sigma factor [Actinomycetota bacterium]
MAPDGNADESELLQRALEGDDRAFSTLLRRHEDRIFALALRMTGSRADALDATQEAFILAFRRAASFRGDAAFSTWLYRIAINACKDFIRKRSRAPGLVGSEEPPEEADPRPAVDDQVALRLDLSEALAGLSDEYREAVVMYDLGGVPYEEIARITGVAIGTVKSRISRGRRQLAKLLEHRHEPGSSKEQI